MVLCHTLVLVTHTIPFACRQLMKNCPRTQLLTHEVRKLCHGVVRSGLILMAILQVVHPPLGQQVLHRHCELLQSLSKLWRPPRENFHNVQRHTAVTLCHVVAGRSCPEPVALFANLPMLRIGDLTPVTLNSAPTL